ncbi:MAG: HD domain-containing protein [Puniceicoccales bacterium]|nr:HD domain-containing protein [Puniceicoccales bacterium]
MSDALSIQAAKALAQGAFFSGIFILRKCATKTARNGAPFLVIEVGDRTGTFAATIFSDSPVFERCSAINEGCIVQIEATVDSYQGRFAPRISTIEAIETEDLDSINLENLVETAPETSDELWEDLQEITNSIPHEGLRNVVQSTFEEIGDVFRTSSAAVAMHHAYRHGLLEHTVHMARAAKALLPIYPEIDPSLALAGILLHDIGKTTEYMQGLVTKRTRTGILQGHVVLGYQLVRKHGLKNKLNAQLLERLEHIILSHQGELEWGAASMAATPEAVFVSMIDNLDAKMGMVQRVLRNAVPGEEFSEYLPGLKAPILLTPPPV